jgi:hypothetical protein
MSKANVRPDEWVVGAERISSFLGITRMTLFRWSKVVPLKRKGRMNNYGKVKFGAHTKRDLVEWAKKAYRAQGKNCYRIYMHLNEAESSLK